LVTNAIVNTSPLLYLFQIGVIEWLPQIFDRIWTPNAVVAELREGFARGYRVPQPTEYAWLEIVDPKQVPSKWLAVDLGAGELAAISLALENPTHAVLLDDQRARAIAQAAGLTVWGTLRVLIEAKQQGLVTAIEPYVSRLAENGMWISRDIRQRILSLAGEGDRDDRLL
jgi:predicted nucleic acid-binding protein